MEDQPIDPASFKHESVAEFDGKYWFHEKSDELFPGQMFSLEIDSILYHTVSQFQDILIFKSKSFGNVLVLNGIIQCTEKDEFSYQELITHVPVMSHKSPKKVLVIGGGDCGVIRELFKHLDKGVEEITMVEIDDMVIKLLAKYLPGMAKYHDHPRLNLIIDDGFKFLKETAEKEENKYDIIITDSSDPEGPAEEFFQQNYFKLLSQALNKDGIVIMQSSENIWLSLSYLSNLKKEAALVFSNVRYCQCYMPSYTSGQLGLLVATNDNLNDLLHPTRTFSKAEEAKLFRYYSSEVHSASFVLPQWADKILNPEVP